MTNRALLINASLIAIVIVAFYLLYKAYCNLKELKEENDRLREMNLLLFKEYVKNCRAIPEDIQSQLTELTEKYEHIDSDIATELISTLEVYKNGHSQDCIVRLGKIIENLLSKKVAELSPARRRTLKDLIDSAKNLRILNEQEWNICEAIRGVRNKLAHEINVQINAGWTSITLLGAIQIIFQLSGEIKPDVI
ncbi:DUF4145 domain-containing protein [Flavobacterium sp.]|uniref:DUF4145 domain-containing protein n=1 Tax=Flavobacterium sp. TaxID=239 RepID=UPI0040337348